eukprot:1548464-Karenia_brevis.AAC.1
MLRPLPIIMSHTLLDHSASIDGLRHVGLLFTMGCIILNMHTSPTRCRLISAALAAAFSNADGSTRMFH